MGNIYDEIVADGVYKFYINGEWKSLAGKIQKIGNPSTLETAFTVTGNCTRTERAVVFCLCLTRSQPPANHRCSPATVFHDKQRYPHSADPRLLSYRRIDQDRCVTPSSISNPSSGSVPQDLLCHPAACQKEQVDAAYDAARKAQRSWARTPLWKRAEYLHKVDAVMKDNAQPIADVLVKEVAKPAKDALTEVVRSGDLIGYTAEQGVRSLGEGKLLLSDSFPGQDRSKLCLASKVICLLHKTSSIVVMKLMGKFCAVAPAPGASSFTRL